MRSGGGSTSGARKGAAACAAPVCCCSPQRAGQARAAFAYQTAVPAVVTAHKKGECTLALLALRRILVRLPHGRRLRASAETRPSLFAPQRGRLADATPAQCSRAEWQGGGTTDHAGCRRQGGEVLHTPTWRGRDTSPPTDDIPPHPSFLPLFREKEKIKRAQRNTFLVSLPKVAAISSRIMAGASVAGVTLVPRQVSSCRPPTTLCACLRRCACCARQAVRPC